MNRPSLAAFGKLGHCADFVRFRGQVAAGTFDGVDGWLRAAHQHLHGENIMLEAPVFWVGPLDQIGGDVTCGVMSASHDSVGRAFPFAVFESLGKAIGPTFSQLPYLRQHFLQQAYALSEQAESLDAASAERELAALAQRVDPPLATLDELQRQGAFPDTHEILRHVFGEPLVDRIGFALAMLDAAAQRPFAAPASVTLRCAVTSDLSILLWLELFTLRCASRKLEPTLLWSPDAQTLLLTLGPPPPAALAWIAQPQQTHAQLWPLQAAQPEIARRLAQPYGSRIAAVIQNPPSGVRELAAALH